MTSHRRPQEELTDEQVAERYAAGASLLELSMVLATSTNYVRDRVVAGGGTIRPRGTPKGRARLRQYPAVR